MNISKISYKNSDLITIKQTALSLSVKRNIEKNSCGLILKETGVAGETEIYAADTGRIIDDFQVVDNNGNVKVIWREYENILFGQCQCHYAVIDDSLKITEHRILSQNNSFPDHFICLRGMVIDDLLVTTCIDTITHRMVVGAFSCLDLAQLVPFFVIEKSLSVNYFNSRQPFIANVVMLKSIDNASEVYLQFLREDDALEVCSIQIEKSSKTLNVSTLFEVGAIDLGFHRSFIDKINRKMLFVYSGKSIKSQYNDIFIFSQEMFNQIKRHVLLDDVSVKVNQSVGGYLKPTGVAVEQGYLIAWEGENIHYTTLDTALNVSEPEAIVQVDSPSNVLLTNDRCVSAQEGVSETRFSGASIYLGVLSGGNI